MLTKAATKSPEEVAKLHKEFDRGLKPRLIPDGIFAFLLQNSPLAEVNIITDYLPDFNIKQAEESLKGLKNIKYHLPFNAPDSSSTEPASPAESDSAAAAAPDSAAPPNLHLYCAEKDDKSSNEDKVEKHQHTFGEPFLSFGQGTLETHRFNPFSVAEAFQSIGEEVTNPRRHCEKCLILTKKVLIIDTHFNCSSDSLLSS
ncbi:hypothetical protein P8452_48338 [Trifolium repens]|nr:hypothetical protein P8452_48338 [Trifolium repens]